jgi:hypothetical protein
MTHHSSSVAAGALHQYLHLHHWRYRIARPHYGLGKKRGILSQAAAAIMTRRRVSFGKNASPTYVLRSLSRHHRRRGHIHRVSSIS